VLRAGAQSQQVKLMEDLKLTNLRIRARTVGVSTACILAGFSGLAVAFAADPLPAKLSPVVPPSSDQSVGGHPIAYADEKSPVPLVAQGPESVSKNVTSTLASSSPGTTVEVRPFGDSFAVQVGLAATRNDVHAVWIAGLAVGAAAEELRTGDDSVVSDVIAQSSVESTAPNGELISSPTGIGAVTLGQRFGSPEDSRLLARVESVGDQFGLKVASTQIHHLVESALEVRYIVREGQHVDWTIDELRNALVGESPMVEGIYIELVSDSGVRLLESGVAYRTGEGGLSFAPNQDQRFNAVHGRLAH
jgi:hypothetical protein